MKLIAHGSAGDRLAACLPDMDLGPALDAGATDNGSWAVYGDAEVYRTPEVCWIVCLSRAAWLRCRGAFSQTEVSCE